MFTNREKTQARLCITVTDTGKREKNVTFWNTSLYYSVPSLIIEICLIVQFCSDIKIKLKKNVLLHDHSKR